VSRDRELRLGTRGSQLALWQAAAVAARLADRGTSCRIVTIKTSGDRLQDAPLSDAGGKRLFVKEIEDALQRGEIDLAVHSSKDMPVELADGLRVGAVLPREDPRDALVLPDGNWSFDAIEQARAALGPAPSIGTGSVRRIAQLGVVFPGAAFLPIRGNLDTRLRRLDEGRYGALVLAAAGLRRLGLERRISLALPPSVCVPAPGQGIVAIEIRAGDEETGRAVSGISDDQALAALTAERAVVSALGGGCQTPIGALATMLDRETIELSAVVASPDGRESVRAAVRGGAREPGELGARVARDLIARGAKRILSEAMNSQP
jgi:hydroxymethylbilane synthase